MKKKLIVLSIDAMIQEDLLDAQAYPHISHILENGARIKNIRSIYPTLTYACHTTMLTGCYPDKHGIVTNTVQIPGKMNAPWQFYHSSVKCRDLHDACKAAGYTTASVGWPVTGNHPNIDYLLDEAWPDGAFTEDSFEKAYLETGTPKWLFESSVKPYLWQRIPKKQPGSTFFLADVSCDIIKHYQPDLLTIHVGNIDAYRHETGVISDKIAEGIAESDMILGKLFEAVRETGSLHNTDFVLTSDHGQINICRTTRINAIFVKLGYIRLDPEGNVIDWDCWCFNCGMSAVVVLRNKDDDRFAEQVYSDLLRLADDEVWGFTSIRKASDTALADRLDGDFSFVLETDGYTEFVDSWRPPIINAYEGGMYGIFHGCHGYHPSKGPSPVFVGCGPSFKKGAIVDHAELVDEAPTFAALMGVSLPDADGKVINALLK